MAAVTSAAMISAGMAFTVMILSMMAALDIGIECQLPVHQRLCRGIRTAGDTAVEPDACCRQSHLCTAADTATNQRIRIQCRQNACQCTVAAAVGIHNLGRDDLSILNIINLELLGMAKVLENHTVFIRNCNSHTIISFLFLVLVIDSVLKAGLLTAGVRIPIAEPIISALDPQCTPFHQNIRQFLSGRRVDQLYRSPGNVHPLPYFLLGKALPVNEANGFVFVHRQNDRGFSGCFFFGMEGQVSRKMTDVPVFSRSWQRSHRLCFFLIPVYSSYWHMSIINV